MGFLMQMEGELWNSGKMTFCCSFWLWLPVNCWSIKLLPVSLFFFVGPVLIAFLCIYYAVWVWVGFPQVRFRSCGPLPGITWYEKWNHIYFTLLIFWMSFLPSLCEVQIEESCTENMIKEKSKGVHIQSSLHNNRNRLEVMMRLLVASLWCCRHPCHTENISFWMKYMQQYSCFFLLSKQS